MTDAQTRMSKEARNPNACDFARLCFFSVSSVPPWFVLLSIAKNSASGAGPLNAESMIEFFSSTAAPQRCTLGNHFRYGFFSFLVQVTLDLAGVFHGECPPGDGFALLDRHATDDLLHLEAWRWAAR